MTFGNDSGELSLINPSGQTASVLSWTNARDGVIVRPQRNFTGNIRARVTHVIDGDTIDVSIVTSGGSDIGGTERVRMIGIDAPEIHASDERQRMLAKRAGEFIRSLLEGAVVTLTGGTDARDAYGRLLAYVATEDGDSVQEMILREGLASVYLRYTFAKETEFIGYQREAQEAGAGVWGVTDKIENEKLKIENIHISQLVVADHPKEASSSSQIVEIVHLEKSSSSSKSSSSKKKSPTPKRAVTVKKSVAVAIVRENSSSAANFSPLSADLLSIQDLIEQPEVGVSSSSAMSNDSSEVLSAPSTLPLISLGVMITGVGSISGLLGWLIARRKT
ncbi:hypothetical protein EXS70_00990 [Candidatus Peribacteria bacterium]|nr:hypothetical protein [Candidatus Peribacteria bacterium]